MLLLVGTRSKSWLAGQPGVFLLDLNDETGQLTLVSSIDAGSVPSYCAIHPSSKFVYAVNEVNDHNGSGMGAVSSFSLNPETRQFQLLNCQLSGGQTPCYVSVDATCKFVIVANYSDQAPPKASVAVLPILADGSLGPTVDIREHTVPHDSPTAHPHCHMARLDKSNKHLLVSDLGLNHLYLYDFNEQTGTLTNGETYRFPTRAGSGPRHLTFHPRLAVVYVCMELNNTVTAHTFDTVTGAIGDTLSELSLLPSDFDGVSSAADIHCTPDGRFVLVSNRGHNSLAIFKIDQESGVLTVAGHHLVHGRKPRSFVIDPSGKYVIVANQDTDEIIVFGIEQGDNFALSSPISRITISAPCFVGCVPPPT